MRRGHSTHCSVMSSSSLDGPKFGVQRLAPIFTAELFPAGMYDSLRWSGPAGIKTLFHDFFVSFVSSCCPLKEQHEDTMTQRLTKNPFQELQRLSR
jgi:hypothetical protein